MLFPPVSKLRLHLREVKRTCRRIGIGSSIFGFIHGLFGGVAEKLLKRSRILHASNMTNHPMKSRRGSVGSGLTFGCFDNIRNCPHPLDCER